MPFSTESGVEMIGVICMMSVLVVTMTSMAVTTNMRRGDFSSTRCLYFIAKSSDSLPRELQWCLYLC